MELDAVLLARIQFALTAGFHFLFPPLTIGMAWVIVLMQSLYLKTKEEKYAITSAFWIKVFAISFVVGVATGIVMEFQFGTNWSEYSRFVGDIFGAPLAAEGVFAFFLESVFVGVLIWGKDKVSKGLYWLSSLMVALGATLSAFWIIVADSWMQTPQGFAIVNGRAQLTDFLAAVFNPSTLPRYFHTVDGALITGSFFVMGLSAWFLLKGKHQEFAERSLKLALVVALFSSLAVLPLGHWHAVQVAQTQPEKLASFEAQFQTERGADMVLFGIPDQEAKTIHLALKIPKLLSLMVTGDANAEIKGLKEFPEQELPPLGITFQSYHLMIALGMYFIAISLIGAYLSYKNKLSNNTTMLKLLVYSIPLPFIANQVGWIAAEVGRQPWIVYRIMKTADAVSIVVPAIQVLMSIIIFAIIYVILFGVWVFLIRRKLAAGPEPVQR